MKTRDRFSAHVAPSMAAKEMPQTLDINGLSQLLQISRWTIYTALTRRPNRIPPPIRRLRGQRLMWLLADVLVWMREQPQQNVAPLSSKKGRPTKSEEIVRRGTNAHYQQGEAAMERAAPLAVEDVQIKEMVR
ncbi:MAG: hypothetical protein KGI81_00305 [Betaproteobacteria bacterium]|nr:hypothetical protein [Betaproteobacteria bacterium]